MLPALPRLEHLCLVVLKNTNQHALLFRATINQGMEPSWLMSRSDGYVEKEPTLLDRSMLGINVEADGNVTFPFDVGKRCSLVFADDGAPALLCEVNGSASRLDVLFVEFVDDRAYTRVHLLGRALEDGDTTHEVMVVDLAWLPAGFFK